MVEIFDPGPSPVSDAIMCDIAKPIKTGGATECATQAEATDPNNVSLTQAGTALATGRASSISLDFSPAALIKCGGLPLKTTYYNPFPQGLTLCLNCTTQIPMVYATSTKACIAKCVDLVNVYGPLPPEGADAFCTANARTSTNYDSKPFCDPRFHGACSDGGTPLGNFSDPRPNPEPVVWANLIGTDDNGGTSTLTRTAATTGSGLTDFNAGAVSAQTIISGDAWVEFEVTETDVAHLIGLRTTCADVLMCPDDDPTLAVGFGIDLHSDGQAWAIENNPAIIGPYGAYSVGERYRVRARDNNDGTATISYSRLIGVCVPGTECAEDVFFTSANPIAYPLRVDTSLRDQFATLTNVTLVRIQQ